MTSARSSWFHRCFSAVGFGFTFITNLGLRDGSSARSEPTELERRTRPAPPFVYPCMIRSNPARHHRNGLFAWTLPERAQFMRTSALSECRSQHEIGLRIMLVSHRAVLIRDLKLGCEIDLPNRVSCLRSGGGLDECRSA